METTSDGVNRNFQWLAASLSGSTHGQVVQKLNDILEELPERCAKVLCRDERPKWFEVEIDPSNPRAAHISIYLCLDSVEREESGPVVVNAGQEAAFDLDDITYDDPEVDRVRLFEDVVRSLLAGRFTEQLFCAGDVCYRSRCRLGCERKPIEVDRTNVPRWLSGLGKKRSRRTVEYASFEETDTTSG